MTSFFTTLYDDLPDTLPVFPLTGVLLLPRVPLPLNIFEPRYLQMVDDAMRGHRLIGMVQPKQGNELFSVGCAGRITSYQETDDNRILITLTGLCRFSIVEEAITDKLYRIMKINWSDFMADMIASDDLEIDRHDLCDVLKVYFDQNGLSMDWGSLEVVACEKLMNMLSIICPLEPSEKQALLETKCKKMRADLLIKLLRMHIHHDSDDTERLIH
jgi:uncharacterized protein